MSLKIRYGSYEFPVMPSFTFKEAPEMDSAGNRKGISVEWTLEGYVKDNGAVAINTLINELKTALAKDAQDLKLLKDSTILQSLLATDCFKGPRVSSFDITEPKAGFLCTNAQFKVVFIGFKATSKEGNILTHEQSINYTTDKFGLLRVTTTGTLQTATGLSKIIAQNFIKSNPLRGLSSILDSSSIDVNSDDTESKYSSVYIELRQEFPNKEVKEGDYNIREDTDPINNIKKVTISGTFKAKKSSDARKAAISLRPKTDVAITESIEENEFNGSCSFSFSYEGPASGAGIKSFQQNVSVSKQMKKLVFVEKATSGQAPLIQETGLTTAKATQGGSAIGFSTYPQFPGYIFPKETIISDNKEKSSPKMQGGIISDYEIRWNYSFESNEDFEIPAGTLLTTKSQAKKPQYASSFGPAIKGAGAGNFLKFNVR